MIGPCQSSQLLGHLLSPSSSTPASLFELYYIAEPWSYAARSYPALIFSSLGLKLLLRAQPPDSPVSAPIHSRFRLYSPECPDGRVPPSHLKFETSLRPSTQRYMWVPPPRATTASRREGRKHGRYAGASAENCPRPSECCMGISPGRLTSALPCHQLARAQRLHAPWRSDCQIGRAHV